MTINLPMVTQSKAAICFLQETHSTKECAQSSSNSKGIMILVNPNLVLKVEKCITEKNGRYILLDLIVDEYHIIPVNIYAPNDVNQQLTLRSPKPTCRIRARKYCCCGRLKLCLDGKRQERRELHFEKSSRYSGNRTLYQPI